MNVTPVGGKSPDSTLLGISVDNNGNLVTKKSWDNEPIRLYEMTELVTTKDTIRPDAISVDDCGAFSLRIYNTTNVSYKIGFYSDVTSNRYALTDMYDNPHQFEVSSDTDFVTVTPDDMPILNWIRNVRLYILPQGIPTTGSLIIWLVKKK